MKKSYEKPEIAKVTLAAEEAVLTHCKSELFLPDIPDACLRPDGSVVDFTIGS